MPYLTRRDFLRFSLTTAGAFLLGQLPAVQADESDKTAILIPPILMLHSRESRYQFLTGLMQFINENDYQAITFIEWMRRAITDELNGREIVITIDDISMTYGNPSFEYFKRMYEWIHEAGHTAVFGVITRPDLEQDPAKWDEVVEWVHSGFEFATHTSYHPTFNAPDSSARRDYTTVDYAREIIASAELIAEQFAQRELIAPVQTLITPYGSGWQRDTQTIHAGIITACQMANIKTVIGIIDGRGAIPHADLTQPDAILYMGRTPPGYVSAEDGTQRLDLALTQYYLRNWR